VETPVAEALRQQDHQEETRLAHILVLVVAMGATRQTTKVVVVRQATRATVEIICNPQNQIVADQQVEAIIPRLMVLAQVVELALVTEKETLDIGHLLLGQDGQLASPKAGVAKADQVEVVVCTASPRGRLAKVQTM
jgi:hypothetical protein